MRFRKIFAFAALFGLALPSSGGAVWAREHRDHRVAQSTVAARVPGQLLGLAGVQNARDLGGYPTENGRHVRWGLLFRTASLWAMTPADARYLHRARIRTVVDFRSTSERTVEPSGWPAGHAPRTLSEDYDLAAIAGGGMVMPSSPMTREQMISRMAELYPAMLHSMNGQYRRMFAEMLAHRAPLLFHCSAGRDRTGVAAALILTALGVPRETIIQDYLLSDGYYDIDRAGPVAASWGGLAKSSMGIAHDAARPSIEAVLKVVDGHAGGAAGYLRDELGLDAIKIARLRAYYTH